MSKLLFPDLKNIMQTILIFHVFFLFSSCEKEAGRGGTSTIKGTIMVQEYNRDFTAKIGDPYPGQGVDVYIIFSDDEVHGDRFKTGWDGKFEFNYLQNGSYRVYALSKHKDNLPTNEKNPVDALVEITGKNQTHDVGELLIFD